MAAATTSLWRGARGHEAVPSSDGGPDALAGTRCKPSPAEVRAARTACCSLRNAEIAAYILSWYTCSIGLTLYNKWLFAIYKLNFPLCVTMLHMIVKAPLARVAMWLFSLPPVQFASWRVYALQVVPVGLTTGADVGLSNMSFLFITVTFYTIVKSSVPAWILLFSFALGLAQPSCMLACVITSISLGISLASYGEMSFVWQGFTMCLGASVCAGLRWALSQLLLTPRPASTTPPAAPAKSARASSAGGAERAVPSIVIRRSLVAEPPLPTHGESSQQLLPIVPAADNDPSARGDGDDSLRGNANGSLQPAAAGTGSVQWREGGAAARASHAGQDDAAATTIHPVSFLFHISPWAALALFPFAWWREFERLVTSDHVTTHSALMRTVLLASAGAVLAFLLILAELLLVRATSGLTLSVAGVFKEVLTIGASILVLGDEVSPINAAGLSITMVGVGVYNVMMLRQRMRAERGAAGAHDSLDEETPAHASQPHALELTAVMSGYAVTPPATSPNGAALSDADAASFSCGRTTRSASPMGPTATVSAVTSA